MAALSHLSDGQVCSAKFQLFWLIMEYRFVALSESLGVIYLMLAKSSRRYCQEGLRCQGQIFPHGGTDWLVGTRLVKSCLSRKCNFSRGLSAKREQCDSELVHLLILRLLRHGFVDSTFRCHKQHICITLTECYILKEKKTSISLNVMMKLS